MGAREEPQRNKVVKKKVVPARNKPGPAGKKNIRINGSAVTRDVDPAEFLEQSCGSVSSLRCSRESPSRDSRRRPQSPSTSSGRSERDPSSQILRTRILTATSS